MTQLTKVNNRVLVVYHYYEKDHSYIDNFSHFIRFAYQPDLDYLIVVAGSYSIELPRAENITYFFATNQNFDFGGYAQAIKALQFDTGYEHFIFVNSSVRGPFLPAYCKKMWIENLLDHFDQDVGIVGTVISLTPSHHAIAKLYHEKYGYLDRNRNILSHVQSTCYALPRSILCHLIATGFYDMDDWYFWMQHSNWKGSDKGFNNPKEIINYFRAKKITTESVNEGVSSTDMDKIKGAVEAANSFMSVGSELKKLGMKYTFATEPLPIYIIQPTPNNKVAIVNKKYATKPDFVVGDIAVGIMESKSSKSVNEGRAFINAARKAKTEGLTEFEFNGKKYPVTIKD
jgi:hypothetical protein